MSEFHDPELGRELARISGPYPDDNAAFAMWQQRVRQARRRRAVALTTGAVLSLIIGTVAVAAFNQPSRHTLVPGESAESSIEVRRSSTTTERASTTHSTEAEIVVTTTVVETTPIVAPVDTSVPEVSVPDTAAAAGQSGPPPTRPRTGTQPTGAPTAAPADTQTFPSVGGSITVRLDGSELTIIAVNPAPGFQADENEHSGERVRVTFESENEQSQITVKLVDGIMTPQVTDRPRGHDISVPETTEADGGHGDSNDGN